MKLIPKAKKIRRLVFLCAFFGPVISHSLFRLAPVTGPISIAVFTWIGVFTLLVMIGLPIEVVTKFLPKRQTQELSPGRRLFLKKSAAFGVMASTGGVTANGVNNAIRPPEALQTEIKLAKWKSEKPLRIAQISDLHVGAAIKRAHVQHVVDICNASQPDLIALTGDLVDGPPHLLREDIEPLSQLKAPLGVHFVTGNHEYYSGVEPWLQEFTSMGFRILRNEHIEMERNGARFYLAGIDDWLSKGRADDHGPDLPKALNGRANSEIPTILLSHQPRSFPKALEHGIDLQLSGHTHGGQIWPFHFVAKAIHGYSKGLYYEGDSAIYVSCGSGFWGPALRLDAPSEVSILDIKWAST